MSVKERLIKFIEFKKLSKSEFCRSISVSTGFVSSMVTSIQPDKIERITLKFPELNIGWLLTGTGQMLINQQDEKNQEEKRDITIPREVFEVIQKQANSLETRDNQINDLIGLLKKARHVQDATDAKCANVSGSDLVK